MYTSVMGRHCSVCLHPKLGEIDAVLVAGAAYRSVAQQFAASPHAMFRHRRDHLPATLKKAKRTAEMAHADKLVAEIESTKADVRRIAKAAEDSGDLRTVLAAYRELREGIELLGKLAGNVRGGPTVNVGVAVHTAAANAAPSETELADTLWQRFVVAHEMLEAVALALDPAQRACWEPALSAIDRDRNLATGSAVWMKNFPWSQSNPLWMPVVATGPTEGFMVRITTSGSSSSPCERRYSMACASSESFICVLSRPARRGRGALWFDNSKQIHSPRLLTHPNLRIAGMNCE